MRTPPSLELFSGRVADFASREFVQMPANSPVSDVVQAMRESRVEHVVLTGRDGRVAGLLTAARVVRDITFVREPSTRAVNLMGEPVPTLAEHEPAYLAVTLLQHRGHETVAVTNADGAPTGIVTRACLGHRLPTEAAPIAARIAQQSSPADRKSARAAQWRLADWLINQCQLPAPPVLSLLSALNNRIYRQVVEECQQSMSEQGWGAPPTNYAVIVMGSGGRGESLLHPDQDNGLILADYPESRRLAVDSYFYELALRMTRSLDDAGLPLCTGYVMATNPSWRKQLSEWQAQILGWLKKPSLAATTLLDICIDFRHVAGDETLVKALRRYTRDAIPNHHGFLRELEAMQFEHDVAITPFRTLKRERLPGTEGDRRVDIKRKGLMPLVEGVRILSLSRGISAASTLERLQCLSGTGSIDPELAAGIRFAFDYLTILLLRTQVETRRAGRMPSAYVAPESLGPRERNQLKEALAVAAALRSKVHGDFTAELF